MEELCIPNWFGGVIVVVVIPTSTKLSKDVVAFPSTTIVLVLSSPTALLSAFPVPITTCTRQLMRTDEDTTVRPELFVDFSRFISLIMSISNSKLVSHHRQSRIFHRSLSF